MVKTSRSGSQKADSNETQAGRSAPAQPAAKGNAPAQAQAQGQAGSSASAKKGRQSGKSSHRPKIGGTAVAGAKSTQQKELTTGAPANQQAEYYNRDMRRRMEHMGTGPYAERAAADPRERRKKRKERLEERQERIRHLVDAKGPSRNVKLGRRNTLFLIGIGLALVILVAAFLIIRHPF